MSKNCEWKNIPNFPVDLRLRGDEEMAPETPCWVIRNPSMLHHSVLVSSRPSAYTHVSATGAILAKHPHLQSMAGSVEFQRRAVDGMNPRSTF